MSNNKPRILITGKNGQVGWESQRSLTMFGDIVAVDQHEMDLSDSSAIIKTIRQVKPDIIVNTAAYTAVDKAESDYALAEQINGIAPGVIAEEANKRNALLIHYSTDYVFNGKKQSAYIETDETSPLNVYGETKLLGEKNITASDVDFVILRTSWVYASRGQNFLLSMLKLASEREELGIVSDQIGSPTTARFLADTSAHIIKQSLSERREGAFKSDLYHLLASSETSWHGFAEEIFSMAKLYLETPLAIQKINAISTEEYPVPAKRPKNSCLSTEKLSAHYDVTIPHWKTLLSLCVQELK